MEPKQRKKYIVGIYVRLSRDDECARGGENQIASSLQNTV